MNRFPILVWEDFSGFFTARLVDLDDEPYVPVAGFGRSPRESLMQLKEYLTWSFERDPWRESPDFHDPALVEFRVEVRPEYRLGNHIYPCEEAIPLRVACVHGRQENGILVCSLPVFGIRFYYHEAKALRNLVTAYVQESLKNHTPQKLSRFLPPKQVRLEEITVAGGRRRVSTLTWGKIRNLKNVADPLGADEMRRSYSRPFERERQVNDLVKLLAIERTNVLLVGESGAGKTSVLVDAVRDVERGLRKQAREDGDRLADESGVPHKFWSTSAARLIAGMKYLGQWEERCQNIIEELSRIDGALAVEDLLDLVRTGGTSATDCIASFLLPYIERGELRSDIDLFPALPPTLLDLAFSPVVRSCPAVHTRAATWGGSPSIQSLLCVWRT